MNQMITQARHNYYDDFLDTPMTETFTDLLEASIGTKVIVFRNGWLYL